MACQQSVDENFELKNKLQVLESIMDTSQTFPKKKKLKRLKNQGKFRVHGGSLNKSGRGNISLNSTIVRQTLRANNRNLAKTLESVRRELKMCQQEKLEAMRETHDLREQVRTLHRVCGLKNDDIEKEVNLRIGERMAEVKSVILKATQGLRNTVPLLMEGLVLCSGTSGRSSSIGSYLSMGEFGSQSSTGSRESPQIDPIDNGTKVSTANRRIFAAPSMNDSESQDTTTVDRPVRSAIPPTLPTVVNDMPNPVVRREVISVRPSDFCQSDLSMIMEQSHLGDLDIGDLDEVCSGRRSSKHRLSRKTKSRGRRSTVMQSRSLEMFQQSLAENSENSSQEGSPLVPKESTSEDTNEIEKNESENVASEEDVPEPQVDPEVNMETEIEQVNEPSKSYECKLNDAEPMENNDDDDDNQKIKSRRTRSRSMKRSKSTGRQTRSKSKARARSPSPESETEDSSAQEQNRPSTSRMSRRDSYEQTRSTEKTRASRSKSGRKSKKLEEESNDTEPEEKELAEIPLESESGEDVSVKRQSRRKSRRILDNKDSQSDLHLSEESVESVASVEAVEDIENEAATKEVKAQPKSSAMRRKSKRTRGKDEEEAEPAEESPKTSDRKSRKSTRKSKRLAVEESAVDTKEETEAVHTDSSTDESPKDVFPESHNEAASTSDEELQKVKAVYDEGKSKRKSRRATKAQFTADDIDAIMISEEPQKEITTEAETPKNNYTANDRRGTFVLNREDISSSFASKVDKEKKERRGTFVMPTAPPPAPRPKKTFSSIPLLERRAKPQEEKEVKQKVEPDRRGTYFVSKPVTPFLEVENIEDIADSILISSTDDDSQSSLLIPHDKEPHPQHEKVPRLNQKRKPKIKANQQVPSAPSPGVVPGETTVLEPQDMELTEALSGIQWTRFSAPEPEFLKNVPGGSDRTSNSPEELNTTVKERLISDDGNATYAVIAESDLEEEANPSAEKDTERNRSDKSVVKESDKDTNKTVEHKEVTDKPRRSRKFRLMKTSESALGPNDTESVTTASETEEQDAKPVSNGRRSRRSTKPVKYTESNSDEENENKEDKESQDQGDGKKQKISDLLKAKSKQKFQAWLSKPGDIKFTGGKRDHTAQLVEDLTKHQRSKSRDRSTIVPKPRARSRSRSRSRPRLPMPTDSPKSEFDFIGSPVQGSLRQNNKSPSAQRKSDSLPKTPGQMSYSEFRGRTPLRKSVGNAPERGLNPSAVPLEPKKTDRPEDEEFTVHDHGIMLLLGNGRRTKPRTKGKSVCMAPEKSNVHLITPMVGKTQSMPRTPPPHGQTQADHTPLTENIQLKSTEPMYVAPSGFRKPTSPPKSRTVEHEPVLIPESPMVSPEKTVQSLGKTSSVAPVQRRSKSSDKYFGFEFDDEDSVIEVHSPVSIQTTQPDLPRVSQGPKKKSGVLSRKSLMEGKPKSPKLDVRSSSSDSPNEPELSKQKNSNKPGLTKSVKKKKKVETDSDEHSSEPSSPEKTKHKKLNRRSQSGTRLPGANKENFSSDSSPNPDLSHKTPKLTRTAKTPAPTKTPAPAKSSKGKSVKKGKTPGTTKKASRVTLTNLKRKLEGIRAKKSDEDVYESQDKKSKINRRLYGDNVLGIPENETETLKRKSEHVELDGVRKDESSPKRPRRAASKVSCYVEPSIGSKLRQGDPGTSSIYQGIPIEIGKTQPKKRQGSSRKRDALHTVTNLQV